MEFICDKSLRDFNAWSGAELTLQVLIAGDYVDDIEEFIVDSFGESLPTATEVNDFLWFETALIAEHLGFDSYEDLVESVKSDV